MYMLLCYICIFMSMLYIYDNAVYICYHAADEHHDAAALVLLLVPWCWPLLLLLRRTRGQEKGRHICEEGNFVYYALMFHFILCFLTFLLFPLFSLIMLWMIPLCVLFIGGQTGADPFQGGAGGGVLGHWSMTLPMVMYQQVSYVHVFKWT